MGEPLEMSRACDLSQALAEGREASGLLSLVQRKRILITVGAGGVGKTTTAAALGLLAVGCGRRTLVMTIDPARRLAVSLGLDELGHEERKVPGEKLEAAGLPEGLLFASMLDQKSTFDEVITRHAADRVTAERILNNKLYHEISTRLAGGQEYAAMEKLYELVRSDAYDLLVLDTPPTANAFDFLEAPAKMVALLDSPAVKLFVKSYETAGRLSFKLLSFGSRYVFRRLARFVGGAFLDDVAEFFADMHSLLDGFGQRAAEVTKLLKGEEVGFVIITTPDRRSIDQAQLFSERLAADGLAVGAVVVNRVHLHRPLTLDATQAAQRLREHGVEASSASELAWLWPKPTLKCWKSWWPLAVRSLPIFRSPSSRMISTMWSVSHGWRLVCVRRLGVSERKYAAGGPPRAGPARAGRPRRRDGLRALRGR
ncbi:MAG: ArsA family ATPase [Deltaproteobacteria bacterium]|nr:ArsA family ATPase [Deltaproteobacteria bacterium]